MEHWQIPRNYALEAAYRTESLMEQIVGSGEATYTGLQDAVEHLRSSAPEDHDVVVVAFNIVVENVGFIDPHTLIFSGLNSDGHRTVCFAHYTQLVAHVISRPKNGPNRVITGFAPLHEDAPKEEDEQAASHNGA